MTLEQLRVFVAVAQMEHFTRAAERLKVSQSMVSTIIAALEAEYKVLMFDRSRRHVELTASGNVFLAEAEAILARVDLAQRRIEDLSELRVGRLAVAASQTVANYWLPAGLNAFNERFPGISIDLWAGNSSQVEARVQRAQVDIGILEQEPNDLTLSSETLSEDQLIAVVGRRHPWFDRKQVHYEEFTQSAWVMREHGSGTRALFETALAENGCRPESLDVRLVLRTGEAVVNAVSTGKSAAVISALVADSALSAGVLHRIEPFHITRNFVMVFLPGRPQTRATTEFIEHLRSYAQTANQKEGAVASNLARSWNGPGENSQAVKFG
jgi:DNA-binding transcriptional LysR family regulator